MYLLHNLATVFPIGDFRGSLPTPQKLRYSTLLLYSHSCCRKNLLTQPPYLGETWYAGHPKHEATEVDSVRTPTQEFQNEVFATFYSISVQAPKKNAHLKHLSPYTTDCSSSPEKVPPVPSPIKPTILLGQK